MSLVSALLPPRRTPDVLVVGAGIAGACVAWHLARAGTRVLLVDRQAPGQEASGGYAGLLTTVADGHEHDAYAELSNQALHSLLEALPELQDRSGIDVALQRMPLLRLADDEASMALLQRYAARTDARDTGAAWLTPTELARLCPAVGPRVLAGVLSPEVHHLSPRALLSATLASAPALEQEHDFDVQALLVRAGRVCGVADRRGRRRMAGHVVLAAGAWGAELLAPLGVRLGLLPVRGQLVVLDGQAAPELALVVHTGRGYIVPKPGRRIVVGATHEAAGFAKAATLAGHVQLSRVAGVLRQLPGLPIAESFVGLRPMSPDGKPLLGTVGGLGGLTLALGYGQHGVLLAQLCAEMCARHVLGMAEHPLWPAFAASRALQPGEVAA